MKEDLEHIIEPYKKDMNIECKKAYATIELKNNYSNDTISNVKLIFKNYITQTKKSELLYTTFIFDIIYRSDFDTCLDYNIRYNNNLFLTKTLKNFYLKNDKKTKNIEISVKTKELKNEQSVIIYLNHIINKHNYLVENFDFIINFEELMDLCK